MSDSTSYKARKIRRIIGAVSIVSIILFTALYFTGYISFIIWLAADIAVWAVANLILRRIGK
jgi:hypothetical protein